MNFRNLLRIFILSTCLSITISGYAIGLDLGDHSSVISSVCKKGVRVLTNKIGGRSTPSVGVFMDRERLLGECTAGGLVPRNLQRAMTNPRKILSDFNPENEKVLKVSMDENTNVELDTSSQIASFVWHLLQASKSNLMELDGQDVPDTIGCVVSSVPAQFLFSQKRVLENALTIACTASHEVEKNQKKMEDNKNIATKKKKDGSSSAGADSFCFPHVGLLTDGAAVALTYGFDRRVEIANEMKTAQEELKSFTAANKKDKSNGLSSNKSDKGLEDKAELLSTSATTDAKVLSNRHLVLGRTVCFVDFGYSCLQVTIAKITDKGAQVLAHTGSTEVSGQVLDQLLFDLAVEKLSSDKHWKQAIEGNDNDISNKGGLLHDEKGVLTKAGVRLMEACAKAKVTLSANPTASVMVECLDGDRDARISFTREDFEDAMATKNIPDLLKSSCQKAVEIANIEAGLLHSVELLGGCSYIPSLRNLVDVTMTYYKPIHSGVRQTMDPLDSVARGCALSAASLLSYSPHIQSRGRVMIPYSINDCTAHPLTLYPWTINKNEDTPSSGAVKVVPAGQPLPLHMPIEFKSQNSSDSADPAAASHRLDISTGTQSAVVDIFEHESSTNLAYGDADVKVGDETSAVPTMDVIMSHENEEQVRMRAKVMNDALSQDKSKDKKWMKWAPKLFQQSLVKKTEKQDSFDKADKSDDDDDDDDKVDGGAALNLEGGEGLAIQVMSYAPKLERNFLGRFFLQASKSECVGNSDLTKQLPGDSKSNKEGEKERNAKISDGCLKTEFIMDSRGQVHLEHSSFDWTEQIPTAEKELEEATETVSETDDTTDTVLKSLPLKCAVVQLASSPTSVSGNPGCVLESPVSNSRGKKIFSKVNLKQKMFQVKHQRIVHDDLDLDVQEQHSSDMYHAALKVYDEISSLSVASSNGHSFIPQTPQVKTQILKGEKLSRHLLLENQFRVRDVKMSQSESSVNSLEETIYRVKSLLMTMIERKMQSDDLDGYFYNKALASESETGAGTSDDKSKNVSSLPSDENWGEIFSKLFLSEKLSKKSVESSNEANNEKDSEELNALSFMSPQQQIYLYKLMKISSSWLEEQPIVFPESSIENLFGDEQEKWFQDILVSLEVATKENTPKSLPASESLKKEPLKQFLDSNLVIKKLNRVELQADKLNSQMLFPLVEGNDARNMFMLMKQKVSEVKALIDKNPLAEKGADASLMKNEVVKHVIDSVKQQQSILKDWMVDKFLVQIRQYHHMKVCSREEFDKLMKELEEKMDVVHAQFIFLRDTLQQEKREPTTTKDQDKPPAQKKEEEKNTDYTDEASEKDK